jgi:hypothetical protein
MTLRGSLIIFGAWTFLAWAAFIFAIVAIDPVANGLWGEIFFFSALFLAVTGTMTILGVFGRSKSSPELASNHLAPAFRQGLLISVAIVAVLVLQRFRFLQWWNILLLGGILVLVDLIFSDTKKNA